MLHKPLTASQEDMQNALYTAIPGVKLKLIEQTARGTVCLKASHNDVHTTIYIGTTGRVTWGRHSWITPGDLIKELKAHFLQEKTAYQVLEPQLNTMEDLGLAFSDITKQSAKGTLHFKMHETRVFIGKHGHLSCETQNLGILRNEDAFNYLKEVQS